MHIIKTLQPKCLTIDVQLCVVAYNLFTKIRLKMSPE
jgi:hypothetical protein